MIFDKKIKTMLVQQLIETLIKKVAGRNRHLCGGDPELLSPLGLTLAHRHDKSSMTRLVELTSWGEESQYKIAAPRTLSAGC